MKRLILLLGLLAVATSVGSAQRLNARFVTYGYAWEQQDTVGTSSQHLFGYQTVQLSVATKDVTVNTYLQGFNDFAGPLKNNGELRVYNLYLNWRNIGGLGELSLGRQFISVGSGLGSIDGLRGQVRLWNARVRVIGYYGSLVPPRQKMKIIDDAGDNSLFGGQVIATPIDEVQVSASYSKKKIKPESYLATRRDSLFNPYLIEINPSASEEEYLNVAVAFDNPALISGYVRYDHDLNYKHAARFEFFARARILDNLSLVGDYLDRKPRISYNSFFSVFAFNSLSEYNIGAEYQFIPDWNLIAKYGSVSYGDEDSWRVTVGVNWKYVSATLSHNTGYNGKISAASLNAGYPLMERRLTPTVGISYAQYKLSEYAADLDDVLSIAPGVVYRPKPWLSIDGQMQWIKNKIYKNDMRFMLRVSYFLSQQLNLL